MQKRLKKEKKAKRKLQEALEFESKRREQVEQALKQAATNESGLRMLKGDVWFGLTHWRKGKPDLKNREGGLEGGRRKEGQKGRRKKGRTEALSKNN